MNHPLTHWLLIWQVETVEPMEDDETFVSYPIVIPTGAEEPLSCSPTGPNCLSNQLDSMNFDRWVTYLYNLKWRARAIFVWPWKMVSVSVRYLFYQPMDEKIKTCTLHFPAKENPNMEKALFDWSIVSQYEVKAKYRLISRKFLGMKFFHPSVRLTNQKPRAFVFVW